MLTERFRLYASACEIKAIQKQREKERLEERLATIGERYAVPKVLEGIELVTPADPERKAEEERLREEIQRTDTASRIYKRRAEFARQDKLYYGRAEMNPGSYDVDEVDNDLVADSAAAGLIHYEERDMNFGPAERVQSLVEPAHS